MIEIASPAALRLRSLPLVVRRRRWRSSKHPPAVSLEHARREKYHPIAGREHLLATLYPSKSPSMVIAATRQPTPATLKSP